MTPSKPSRQDAAVLARRPAVFHILLALSTSDRHGLGIADEVERTSGAGVELGPGTLYRSIAELVEAGLIRSVKAPNAEADPRRKYYRLTASGRTALAAEVRRLEQLLHVARAARAQTDPA